MKLCHLPSRSQFWERLNNFSSFHHGARQLQGHYNLIRLSLAAQELISVPTPAPCPMCAQIPGTLPIKDASSEQISFTLIRTRKIRVWGEVGCV